MKIDEIIQAQEYLSYLNDNKSDYIIVISARDNPGKCMPEGVADTLISLGCTDLHRTRGLSGIFQRAYIAIIDGGVMRYEKLGMDEPTLQYSDDTFNVISSKFFNGPAAHISIRYSSYEFAPNTNGLNILTINKSNAKPVDAISIDYTTEAVKFSRPFSMEELDDYEEFRREYKPVQVPKLSLYTGTYPYGETAVVLGSDEKDALYRFADEYGLNKINLAEATVLSSASLAWDGEGVRYLFTGIARWRDKLLIGQRDVANNKANVSEIREAVGCFALLTFNGEDIEISSDYFGAYSWFYYSKNGLTVCATTYHFLLLTLQACGEQMQLDTDRVLAGMSFFGAAFESGMSSRMDVSGCIELSPDKRIVLSKDRGMVLEDTSLCSERHNPEKYTEELYEEYLLKAKDEIIENCKAVFNHPAIDFVRCDLSGGADTRLTLSAVLNLPKSLLGKLRIYSSDRKELVKDFEIANQIVSDFGLKWDDISYMSSVNPEEPREGYITSAIASQDLGIENEYVYGAITEVCPRTIRLTGAYGEVITKKRGTYHGARTDRGIDSVMMQLCIVADINPNGPAGVTARQYILDELNKAQSSDLDVMLDYYSLESYSRHHFTLKHGNLVWSPLMSKSGYRLKKMYTTVYKDLKLRFDLMAELHPLLSCYEYDNQSVNEEKAALRNRLYSPYNGKMSQTYKPDDTAFIEAGKRKKRSFYPSETVVRNRQAAINLLLSSTEIQLSALKSFLEYSDKFNELGFPLFRFFHKERSVPQYVSAFRFDINRISRLLQIFWQIQIISRAT
jgi:hypothetical protein